MSGSGPPTGTLRSTRPTRRRPAASRKTRAADARTAATTRRCPTSRLHARSSRAPRISARRTIAAAIVPRRDMRSRSIHPRATWVFAAYDAKLLMHAKRGVRPMFDRLPDANARTTGAALRKGPHTRGLAALMGATALMTVALAGPASAQAPAQPRKPNIIMIVSDDTGYGDLGPYGGGIGRGMPTPNIDKLAAEGMTLHSFYAQPSCTPGRAAMQTGRIPNRSGMTTVAFQGQGGGLPAAEWTLGSMLKTAGYKTFFTGKWHLGEADYALPNAQGYDEMRYAGLYHLNAYTYADPTWFPDMSEDLRAMFARVTKGALSGNAGQAAREDFKINGQYVNTPDQGVVGIPFFDEYVEKASLDYLDRNANSGTPFFMSVNFMKVHQPNMPAPEFEHKSTSKTKFADSVVENDTRIGRIIDKVRALGLDKNTYVFWTTDNGAWQDVYPDAGYTPFRGTKGTVREGGNRVPSIAWGPRIKAGSRNSDIVGGLDFMATFAALAGTKLPDKDREGQPIVFDSYDMSPLLFGSGKSADQLVLLHRG